MKKTYRLPPEPKPFAYISLPDPDTIGRSREKYIEHDQFKEKVFCSGRLDLQIMVVSEYLFVGSGLYDFKADKVYHSFYRCNNEFIIPGSSIRGAVRSVLEAISNSCVLNTEKGEIAASYKKCKFDEGGNPNLCPACRIFGTTGYKGRVSFSDAIPLTKIKSEIVKIGDLFPPRISKEKRKFYQHKAFSFFETDKPEKGTRFVEAIPKGSKFMFHIDFINMSQEELSLLLYTMGIYQDYFIKIGGAKPRCFGTVRFEPKKLIILNSRNPFEEAEVKERDDLSLWIKEIMRKNKLLREDFLDQYKSQTNKEKDFCPRGNY